MTDWPVKTLGDICEIYQPQTIGLKDMVPDGPYVVYGANGPIGRYDRFNHEKSEVTVTCRGATCGTVNVTPPQVWITGNAMVVRPNESEMSKLLLKYWLEGLDYSSVITGTAQPQITRTTLSPMKISVPPLDEQKRIVALLDAATARVTELTACYEQARAHANNLFTSALREALESNPDWPVKTLGDVCDFVRGVTFDKADARSEMKSGFIPLLRATNITEKGLLRDDFVFVPKNGVRADQKLITGDALITIASGSVSVVGRSVLVEDPGEMTFGAFCGVLRPSPEILPRYLSHFMSSRSVRDAWSEAAQGTNINNLKRDDILQTECLLPPLDEQKRIVARLDAMRAKTSEMVAAYDSKLTAAKNLRQSILESAFEGKL